MNLYNQRGDSFQIGLVEWTELLAAAEAGGWAPAGTAPPPVALDLNSPPHPWDCSYHCPEGQRLLRQDAAALSTALRAALESGGQLHVTSAAKAFGLVWFCSTGGFIVCAQTPHENRAASARARQLVAMYQSAPAAEEAEEEISEPAMVRRAG